MQDQRHTYQGLGRSGFAQCPSLNADIACRVELRRAVGRNDGNRNGGGSITFVDSVTNSGRRTRSSTHGSSRILGIDRTRDEVSNALWFQRFSRRLRLILVSKPCHSFDNLWNREMMNQYRPRRYLLAENARVHDTNTAKKEVEEKQTAQTQECPSANSTEPP
jgi:hypothetical protein